MSFGDKIRELRLHAGLSLSDLADMSGVSKGYLSQLENGKRTTVSIPVARKIARSLDADLDSLFGNGAPRPDQEPTPKSPPAYPDVIKKLIRKRQKESRPLNPAELETLLGLQYRGQHPDSPEELELLLDQLKYFTRKPDD